MTEPLETNADRLKLAPGTYTALFIWQRILEIVKEEPLRLRMKTWCSAIRGQQCVKTRPVELPACGTVMCMAGWWNFLVGCEDQNFTAYRPGMLALYDTDPSADLYNVVRRRLYTLFFSYHLTPDQAIQQLEAILTDNREELSGINVMVS